MEILSIALLALVLAGIASAWFRFRSNWLSIQKMRSENLKAPVEPGFDVPEDCDSSQPSGHTHDVPHHAGDAGGHHTGGFDAGDHGWSDGGGHH